MKSFGESDFEVFFSLMGCQLVKRGGNQFLTRCPFGHNHASGSDKHPSFSIIYGGLTSGWKCFGCNDSGTLRSLAKKYNENFGDSRPIEFIRSFDDNRAYGERAMSKGSYREEQAKKIARLYKKAPSFKKPLTEEELKYFLEEYPKYASDRGMTNGQILRWEIGFDPRENRMIIPVRDMHKKLYGVSGRGLSEDVKPKYRHYPGLNKEMVLYGEQFLDLKSPTCYLVEGFFDVYNLERLGLKNCFATMGTSLSEVQMNKILRYFREVIFVPDGVDFVSRAGLHFAEDYGQRLYLKKIKVGIAGVDVNPEYEHRAKPKKWEPQDFKYQIVAPLLGKDPSDLTKEELQTVLDKTQYFSLV